MYTQNHTRTILLSEKKSQTEVLAKVKTENAQSDRAIKQGKLAMSKKEAKTKEKKEERDHLHEDIEHLNDEILKNSWTLDK